MFYKTLTGLLCILLALVGCSGGDDGPGDDGLAAPTDSGNDISGEDNPLDEGDTVGDNSTNGDKASDEEEVGDNDGDTKEDDEESETEDISEEDDEEDDSDEGDDEDQEDENDQSDNEDEGDDSDDDDGDDEEEKESDDDEDDDDDSNDDSDEGEDDTEESDCPDRGFPDGMNGVVIAYTPECPDCVPLCAEDDPMDTQEGDDWAYEDNHDCIYPDSTTAAANTPCITGEPLPEAPTKSGVVIWYKEDESCDGDAKTCEGHYECIAVCEVYLEPEQEGANTDGLADDWAWENNAACIIPGTITELGNTACDTGDEEIPTPEPRPGIFINGDPVKDSCLWTECVPLCRVVTEGSDSEYPDWGWEDNMSCVIPGTETANFLPDGDIVRGCVHEEDTPESDCYYKWKPRLCTWGETESFDDWMNPPEQPGPFSVDTGQILDPNGTPFVMHGINSSNGWFDACGQYMAYDSLELIEAAGANTVRIGWGFETINPGGEDNDTGSDGEPEKDIIGTNPLLLAEILYKTVSLGLVPIVAVNDSTGQTDALWPPKMADFWVEDTPPEADVDMPSYLDVIKAYENYLFIGIANEWRGTTADFETAYKEAIDIFRDAGVKNPLVITANEWGQGCSVVDELGAELLSYDPEGNVIFDLHLYTYLDWGDCRNLGWDEDVDPYHPCATPEIIQECLDSLADKNIPTIVGEFGESHSSGNVAWERILERTEANGQGRFPWLWYGDTEYPVLNMNDDWDGPLTSWGSTITPYIDGTKATIF